KLRQTITGNSPVRSPRWWHDLNQPASMKAGAIQTASPTHRFIEAIVTLKNAGNTQIEMDLKEQTLFIAEVNIFGSNLVADETLLRLSHLTTLNYKFSTLPPGNTIRIPYLAKVEKPGLYFVEFRLPWEKSSDALGGAVNRVGSDFERRHSVTSAFVNVEDPARSATSTGARSSTSVAAQPASRQVRK
ncbi:hypothetical protein, partial [Variovorax sp. Root318D1]|uniref:hypothetical protein n=1 Tax=Variovorax sp. Root318D1 TaxID=1736513 RepID=UPI001F225DD5